MLETKIVLKELGCNNEVINKIIEIEKNKVVNLNPYNINNSSTYLKDEVKEKVFELPLFLKFMNKDYSFYILNVKNFYECILALFDDEYFEEEEKVNIKYAEYLRIRLLTDLDEKYSDLKNKKKVREILDNKASVNEEIFFYIKQYFGVNIFNIKQQNQSVKKYENLDNDNCVFIINIDNNYYPIIGKKDTKNIRLFNLKEFEQFEFFTKINKSINTNTDYSKLALPELQQKAEDLNIKIMKKNKKGDKEIKKTKKELILEIELQN